MEPLTAGLLGAGVGGLLGGLGSGSPDNPEIPSWVREPFSPYRRILKKEFENQYDPQFFPGQTYAAQSPFTNLAIQQMGGFSTQPSQDYFSDVMSGQYLPGGEGFQQAMMNPAIEAVNAKFNQMGRWGSQANQEAATEAAMRAYAPYYGRERALQQNAALRLPQMQELQAQQQLMGGGLEEQWAQKPITENMQRWDFNQNQPLIRMQNWGSLFAPITGGAQTMYQPQQGGSMASGILGGALMGGMLGSQFGTPNQAQGLMSAQLQPQPGWNQAAPFMPAGTGLPTGWY